MSPLQRQWLDLVERLIRAIDRLAIGLRGASPDPEHLQVGRRGEEAAYFHLRRSGYTVVARGWRNAKRRGDLDLIAWEGDTLCFIEVKTRTSRSFATAESAVDEEKSRMLRSMARLYLRGLPSVPQQARFDILSVYFEDKKTPEFELFRGALDWY